MSTTDLLLEAIIAEELEAHARDSAGGAAALVNKVAARLRSAAADIDLRADDDACYRKATLELTSTWSAKLTVQDIIRMDGPDVETGVASACDQWTLMLIAAGQTIDSDGVGEWDFGHALDSCVRVGYELAAKAVVRVMPVPPTHEDVVDMLCTAVRYGHVHMLHWLRAEYGDIINASMRNGVAHVVAAGWCKLDMLKYLHEHWGPMPGQYLRQAFVTAAITDCVPVLDWCLATDPNEIKTSSLFDDAYVEAKERGCAGAVQWFEHHSEPNPTP